MYVFLFFYDNERLFLLIPKLSLDCSFIYATRTTRKSEKSAPSRREMNLTLNFLRKCCCFETNISKAYLVCNLYFTMFSTHKQMKTGVHLVLFYFEVRSLYTSFSLPRFKEQRSPFSFISSIYRNCTFLEIFQSSDKGAKNRRFLLKWLGCFDLSSLWGFHQSRQNLIYQSILQTSPPKHSIQNSEFSPLDFVQNIIRIN